MHQQRTPNDDGSNRAQRSDLRLLSGDKKRLSTLAPRATGPRTSAGKNRSKYNAIKHGIFSKAVLLRNESRQEFDALLNGLRNDRQPEGFLEEWVMGKIATDCWRHQRLLLAESAEIELHVLSVKWEEQRRQEKAASELLRKIIDPTDLASKEQGLMSEMDNPQILEKCLNLLKVLKLETEASGFDPECGEWALNMLYGYQQLGAETVAHSYKAWRRTAECSDEEREQGGFASEEECKRIFLETLRADPL